MEAAVTETERLKEAEVARLKRDMARLEEENTFLKKPRRTAREAVEVKYALIRRREGQHPVASSASNRNPSKSPHATLADDNSSPLISLPSPSVTTSGLPREIAFQDRLCSFF